jgi:hypothetical protein
MKISPWMSAALVAVLIMSGPLAPLAAFAQTQMGQAPPAAPPAAQPQPGYERVPIEPSESMLIPDTEPITSHDPTQADAVEAGFMNVIYIPGKAIVCTLGGVTATVLMLLTFGSAYRAARGVLQEGCSQPWALTAEHMSGKIPGPGDPGYDAAGQY